MIRRLVWLVVSAVVVLSTSATAQDVVEYYGTDAIGSVRIVFDINGAVVGRMDYGPFGEQLTVSTVGHKSYAGLFRDGEAGLDYAEARSYQVRTGRFNGPDPVYAGLFNPQAWNRYTYALNAPTGVTDTTGLQAEGPDQGNCGAEFSFERCGGNRLFWDLSGGGGLAFGGGYGEALNDGYDPSMPSNVWEGVQAWLKDSRDAFDQWLFKKRIEADVERYAVANNLQGAPMGIAASPQAAGVAAIMTAVATAAANTIPRAGNTAATWGTRVHTLVANAVRSLQSPEIRAEVSFLNGEIVNAGTSGSVRLDAVIIRGREILHIFDLKTGVTPGSMGMSATRAQQIYSQLGGQRPPIHIIRPVR